MVVVANGRPWRSMSLRSSDGSATRMADDPITATGRLAAAISSAARAIVGIGSRRHAMRSGCGGTVSVVGASATSSGRSRCTGPIGSLMASAIAALTVSAMRPRSSRSVALVIGLNSAWWSIHIWMRRPSWSVLRLQVMAIIGERSRKAEPTPVARLVAPGPRSRWQDRGAGEAASDVGSEAGRALMGGQHELDAALCASPPSAAAHCHWGCRSRGVMPAAFRVATIRSALFMGFWAWLAGVSGCGDRFEAFWN